MLVWFTIQRPFREFEISKHQRISFYRLYLAHRTKKSFAASRKYVFFQGINYQTYTSNSDYDRFEMEELHNFSL